MKHFFVIFFSLLWLFTLPYIHSSLLWSGLPTMPLFFLIVINPKWLLEIFSFTSKIAMPKRFYSVYCLSASEKSKERPSAWACHCIRSVELQTFCSAGIERIIWSYYLLSAFVLTIYLITENIHNRWWRRENLGFFLHSRCFVLKCNIRIVPTGYFCEKTNKFHSWLFGMPSRIHSSTSRRSTWFVAVTANVNVEQSVSN